MMMAACGIDCAECPAYLATVRNDDELRRQTAEKWSAGLGIQAKPEDLNCLGCRSETVFGYCSSCDIRNCQETSLSENCSDCSTYPCDRISKFLANAPKEKARLDALYTSRDRK